MTTRRDERARERALADRKRAEARIQAIRDANTLRDAAALLNQCVVLLLRRRLLGPDGKADLYRVIDLLHRERDAADADAIAFARASS